MIKIEINGCESDRDASFALITAACKIIEKNQRDPIELLKSFIENYQKIQEFSNVRSFEVYKNRNKK
jgi:hypothetical protein